MKDQIAKLMRMRWPSFVQRSDEVITAHYQLTNGYLVTITWKPTLEALEVTSYNPQDNIIDYPNIIIAEEALAVLMLVEAL